MATSKAKSESITLRLEDQISASADAANSSLGRLERQIIREQNALTRLESSLGDAKAKLQAIAAGAPSVKAVQAFERQSAVVDSLRQKLALLESTGDKGATAASKKLAESQAKLDTLRGPATSPVSDVSAYKKQRDAVAALTDKIAAQRDKIGGLSDKLTASKKFTQQMGDASKMLGAELGVTGSRAAQLGKSLAAIGPYGAIAAAAILVVVGSVAALVSVFAKAFSSFSTMRGEFLKLQASSVNSAMGFHWLLNSTRESSASAERMTQSINRVSANTDLARDKLAGYAAQINAARFYGEKAETVLRAMSIAGSAGSEQMAQEVLQMSRAYRFAGGSVDELAKRVEQKLGRTALEKSRQLDAQLQRLGQNITWIFGGADFDPLLRAMNTVLSLFNAGGKSATSMREMVTKMVERAIGGILDLGIVLLRGYIALRQHETAWKVLTTVIKFAVVGFFGLATVITAVVATLLMIPPAMTAVQAAIIGAVLTGIVKSITFLKAVPARMVQLGRDIVRGLANGIIAAKDEVVAAITGIIDGSVIGNVRKLLDEHSPSRVMFRSGINTGAGMAGGIRASAPMVMGASSRMTAGIVATSRAAVANDVRAPMIAPRIEATAGIGAFGGRVTAQPATAERQRPTVEFNNCSFGGGSTEQSVKAAVLMALEEADLAAGKAA